eukprot:2424704-Rhodomonas_salina.1
MHARLELRPRHCDHCASRGRRGTGVVGSVTGTEVHCKADEFNQTAGVPVLPNMHLYSSGPKLEPNT